MTGNDPAEEFVWKLPAAIGHFADAEIKRLAVLVSDALTKERGLPHLDTVSKNTLWHQYCEEVQHGPSPLRTFWDLHVDPFIDSQVCDLTEETALLVSSAVAWERDELNEDGILSVSAGLIRDSVRSELHRLALDEPIDELLDESDEHDGSGNLGPTPTPPRTSLEVARQNGRESRSILVEFSDPATIRLSGQDLGPFVQTVTGDDDYEFWVDVDYSALPDLTAHLLQERYRGNLQAVSDFRAFCESKQIPHKYMTF